jgi:hypothetical protein
MSWPWRGVLLLAVCAGIVACGRVVLAAQPAPVRIYLFTTDAGVIDEASKQRADTLKDLRGC